jgi:hypothetical protein
MNDRNPTKQIRIYQDDNDEFSAIKKQLSDRWRRQASNADVIRLLISFYLERKGNIDD